MNQMTENQCRAFVVNQYQTGKVFSEIVNEFVRMGYTHEWAVKFVDEVVSDMYDKAIRY
jgi:hypothetical protein